MLHRGRGVKIGRRTWIGFDTLIEPSYPARVEIGEAVAIRHPRDDPRALRAPWSEQRECNWRDRRQGSVRIEDDAFIGPGVIIMPNVTIGHGAVVASGSVVTRSVAPLTMVQGNPAQTIARCGVPLGLDTPIKEFYQQLTPIERASD
jgi:acetyltransferase-like isoleucine patch superfamily enzyme